MLIDDASPDPRIAELLAELASRGLPQLTLLRQCRQSRIHGTANRAMALSRNDVVLLNSDTIVPQGWLDALIRCAESDPRIGTITPFSNNAEILSFPRFCANNAWLDATDPTPVAQAISRRSGAELSGSAYGSRILPLHSACADRRHRAFRHRLWRRIRRGERFLPACGGARMAQRACRRHVRRAYRRPLVHHAEGRADGAQCPRRSWRVIRATTR